jgi:hypothetical protein
VVSLSVLAATNVPPRPDTATGPCLPTVSGDAGFEGEPFTAELAERLQARSNSAESFDPLDNLNALKFPFSPDT